MIRVALVCLLLAGCASTPRERVVVREVKVPVAVACAPQVPAKPTYVADEMLLDGTIFDLVQGLLVDREQRKAREVELEAAIKGCGP